MWADPVQALEGIALSGVRGNALLGCALATHAVESRKAVPPVQQLTAAAKDKTTGRGAPTHAPHAPEPRTQTRDQRSASELHIDQWRRSPERGFEEMSSRSATRLRRSRYIFGDRRLGHLKAMHPKLAVDPGCAPKWVFPAHPPDPISQATINSRPPCPMARFPTPKHFETSAMPTQDGPRLKHLHRTKQARPKPRHP